MLSLTGSQVVDQWICCFGPGLCWANWSAALGLSCAAGGSAALGLCMGQLASAPSAHLLKVSSVGAPQGFQVWVTSWDFSCGPPVC